MRLGPLTDYPRESTSNTLAKDHHRDIAHRTSDATRSPIAYAVVRRELAAELTKKPLDGEDGRTLKIELRQFQVGGGELDGAPQGQGNRVVRFRRLIITAEKIVRAFVVPCDPHGAKSLPLLAAGQESHGIGPRAAARPRIYLRLVHARTVDRAPPWRSTRHR